VPYDLSKPLGRLKAYLNMQLEDHGFIRSIYNNFYALPGGMYRCSQPSPAQIRKYHRLYGIKTIVNLRGENPYGGYALEVATCRELGIELIDFNLYSRDMPSVEEVLGARDLFKRIAYPALMHCKSGADRAGLGATFYRHFRLGEPSGRSASCARSTAISRWAAPRSWTTSCSAIWTTTRASRCLLKPGSRPATTRRH